MSDLIRRQDALDALGEEPLVWYGGWDEIAERNQWRRAVKAIKAVPTAWQEKFEWCHDCKEYDQTAHCCHRWTKVIRQTVAELKAEPKPGTWIYDGDCYKCNKCGATYSWWADSQTSNYCPNCGAWMKEGEERV